jgi:arylesterase/paraoxonase
MNFYLRIYESKKMRKAIWFFSTVALSILLYLTQLLIDAGAFTEIRPHFSGECETYSGIPGAEDMEFSQREKILFISSDERRDDENTSNGALWIWPQESIEQPLHPPVKLPWTKPFPFHPHGIGLLDQKDRTRLWVVNHRTPIETTIEVFESKKNALEHVLTIADPVLVNANDIAPADADHFYVSLDHRGPYAWQKKVEDYLRLSSGRILFYNGATLEVKMTRLRFANGMQLTQNGEHLFVASMTTKNLLKFKRDKHTNNLDLEEKIELTSAPDNLTLTNSDQTIWVSAHPKLLTLARQAHDRTVSAPAQIFRINLKGERQIEEIFLDDGTKISSTSIAVPVGNKLILGSIYDHRILKCELNP